jgi:hypothetical protein
MMWVKRTRYNSNIAVEIMARIRKTEAASRATSGEDSQLRMETLAGRQFDNKAASATRIGFETQVAAELRPGCDRCRRLSQRESNEA